MLKKILISCIAGTIIGFTLNYFVFSEIIYIYFNFSPMLYQIIAITAFIVQILFSITLVYLMLNRKIDSVLYKFLVAAYCFVMLVLLFGRPSLSREINVNLFSTISNISNEDILLIFLNFIAFIPIGYLLRKQKLWRAIVISFLLAIAIEGIQYITATGIADILDFAIYLISINLSYVLVNLFHIEIVAEDIPDEKKMECE